MRILISRSISLFDRVLVTAGLIVGARLLLVMAVDELASRRALEAGTRAKALTAGPTGELQEVP
ncbi:hypothetical protein [Nocardia sp. NPDC127526]|uniref:hypothetical protein n=1 Tax=Nocardia sp. NPDC127526 TaxID=3345393 RepID=UPI00362681C2